MKAVIIAGSERPDGITSNVCDFVKKFLFDKGVESHIVNLHEISFSPCDSCGDSDVSCNYRVAPCEKDDEMPSIINKMKESHIILYITPVHAFGTSHLMQTFLERSGVGYLRFERPLSNKIGGCIVVGRKYSLGSVHDQIVNNMLLNRMIIPGSGFPVLIHGNEKTKSITDIEETVALEQMLSRLVEVSNAIDSSSFKGNWDNERELKRQKESVND